MIGPMQEELRGQQNTLELESVEWWHVVLAGQQISFIIISLLAKYAPSRM